MNNQMPSLRARRRGPAVPVALAATPIQAPAAVAAQRLRICQACEHATGGHCRLFACCQKDLSQTVQLALQQCPAGHWPRWLPTNPKP